MTDKDHLVELVNEVLLGSYPPGWPIPDDLKERAHGHAKMIADALVDGRHVVLWKPEWGDPDNTITVALDVARKVFDAAVESMDFGSGFLDDEEVEALRAFAVALGVDPETGTPFNFRCKYGTQAHSWYPYRVQGARPAGIYCASCGVPKPV